MYAVISMKFPVYTDAIIQLAANRQDTLPEAFKKTWSRGRFLAFYQGLIPWVCAVAHSSRPLLPVFRLG